jgi:hypothetical protein
MVALPATVFGRSCACGILVVSVAVVVQWRLGSAVVVRLVVLAIHTASRR